MVKRMRTILTEFKNIMSNILNNFNISFLAINFLNQRPFKEDVTLAVKMYLKVMDVKSLNTFSKKHAEEYANSIRRHFLNDMIIAYERYSTLMIASHKMGQCRTNPCIINDRTLTAHQFEKLKGVYQLKDKRILTQLRRLRNTVVHYNSCYSANNKLNYTFGTQTFNSRGREGQPIEITFDNLMWIYNKLIQVVQRGNFNYFTKYPLQ